ncbi:MAG: metal-dependent transcriptional regulator [Oscillospiraceae bacterium]|nr:metal-dependent transcriptional regulator [Oscillospiraceae bacterium]MDD4368813.1 metal-dependent transcriptional regulator [Oscillospiraceae bacterium]
MKLSDSQIRYIEAVYDLSCGSNGARTSDIADRLAVSRPSVSLAVKKLMEAGLMEKDGKRRVLLTAQGETAALQRLDKVAVIARFLSRVLGVGAGQARQDAQAIASVVSPETLCSLCHSTRRHGFSTVCGGHCQLKTVSA